MGKPNQFSLGIGIIVVGKFLAGISGLLATFFMVRLLEKQDVGIIRFLQMIAGTFAWIFAAGVPKSILYFLPKYERERQKAICWQNLLLLLGLGLVGALLIFGCRGALSHSLPNTVNVNVVFLLISCYFVLELPSQTLEHILIALQRHKLATVVSISFSIIQMAGVLIPAFLSPTVTSLLWGILISGGIRLATTVTVVVRLYAGVQLSWWAGGMLAQLRYAIPLGLSGIVGYINQLLDKYLVAFLFTAAVFAEYDVGAYQLPLVSILPYTVATVLLPRFVEILGQKTQNSHNHAELLKLWHQSITKVSLIIVPIFVFLLVTAEHLIVLLFSEDYLNSVIPFRLYLFMLPIRVTAYGIVVQAFGQTKPIFKMSLLSLGINIVLSCIFVMLWGIWGPPIATVLAQYVGVAYLLRWICRLTECQWRSVFPWREYGRIAAVSLVSVIPVVVLYFYVTLPVLPLFLLEVSVFAVCYLAAINYLNLLTRSDKAYLKNLMSPKQLFSDD